MASFGKHFTVNEKDGLSLPTAVHKGDFYRITVLTDRLVRLEYSVSGNFVDNLTDLVSNRNFPVPLFDCRTPPPNINRQTMKITIRWTRPKRHRLRFVLYRPYR